MEIRNLTNRPLRVALPLGKQLHLAPNGTGQITVKASESAAVKKLIEAGTIALGSGEAPKVTGGSEGKGPKGESRGGGGGGPMRRPGDR